MTPINDEARALAAAGTQENELDEAHHTTSTAFPQFRSTPSALLASWSAIDAISMPTAEQASRMLSHDYDVAVITATLRRVLTSTRFDDCYRGDRIRARVLSELLTSEIG